jgi:hypothetical protein
MNFDEPGSFIIPLILALFVAVQFMPGCGNCFIDKLFPLAATNP